MKKVLFVIASLLIVVSVFIGAQKYKTQIGQGCGGPALLTIERDYWLWEWWPHSIASRNFVTCEGPSTYAVYRPLDIAAVGVGVSLVLLFVTARKK